MVPAEDLEKIEGYERGFDAGTCLVGSAAEHTSVQSSAEYAALLFQRGDEADISRATTIVDAIIGLQVDDLDARTHGQFPMGLGRRVGDLNATLFLMPHLIQLLANGAPKMPTQAARRYAACVQRGILAAERRWDEERFDLHRDHKAYTNIFLLYIQALLLAGNHYGDPRLSRKATAQWQRWFNHISYYGIDEFASPTYGNVDYSALKTIHEQSQDAQVRKESGAVLQHLSALVHAVTHPVLRLQVCGSSRNYRRFLSQEACETQCVREGPQSPYTPDGVRDEYRDRSFPYTARGRATAVPFRFQSWQDRHAAVGTMTGGNYFWQQIHCMLAVGRNGSERAVAFIPGAYTPTSGYVCQRENTALCVFTRQPNTYHRTQSPMPDEEVHAFQRGFGIGLTANWSHRSAELGRLTLSAYGHEVDLVAFDIRGGQAHPVELPRVQHDDVGQGRFHPARVSFDALQFPPESTRFGCLLTVRQEGAPGTPLRVSCTEDHGTLSVRSDNGLSVRLFQQPSGEVTELYEDDWRISPLLECPTQTLHPGELSRLVAQQQPR